MRNPFFVILFVVCHCSYAMNYGLWNNCTISNNHTNCQNVWMYDRDFKIVISDPLLMIEFLDQTYIDLCDDPFIPSCENFFCPYHNNLNVTVDKNPNLSEAWMDKYLSQFENDTQSVMEHERELMMSYVVNNCLYCRRQGFDSFHEMIRSNSTVLLTNGERSILCPKFSNFSFILETNHCHSSGLPVFLSIHNHLSVACNCDSLRHIRASCDPLQNMLLVMLYHVMPFIYIFITTISLFFVIIFIILPSINRPISETPWDWYNINYEEKVLQNSVHIRLMAKCLLGVVFVCYLFCNSFELPFSNNIKLYTMFLSPLLGSVTYAILGIMVHSRMMGLFVAKVVTRREFITHALLTMLFFCITLVIAFVGAFMQQVPSLSKGFIICFCAGFVNTLFFMGYTAIILIWVRIRLRANGVPSQNIFPQSMRTINRFIATMTVISVLFMITWLSLFICYKFGNNLYLMLVNELNIIITLSWNLVIAIYLYERRFFLSMLGWKIKEKDKESEESSLIEHVQ